MARRRKKSEDLIWMVAQLAGLVILLSLASPQLRQTISAVDIVACLFGMTLVGLLGFGLYRWATRSQSPPSNSPQTTAELLDQLRSIDWFQFEKIVALAYGKLGYTVTRRGGANADGGIDLVIEKDGHRSAVQCKQWKKWSVGVKAVREFLGALTDAGIQKGIFITLRGYTGDAKRLAEKHGIEIVNEVGLAQMLELTDYRFDPDTLSILGDRHKFCPKCESEMVLRTATKGIGAGNEFWGCSTYPRCRFTMSKN
jgi:restriction system protein